MGLLVVTVNVANKTGHLVPSDYKVFVHGNDPMPSSFNGNKSGTLVKLHMGMYSVTTLGPDWLFTSIFWRLFWRNDVD